MEPDGSITSPSLPFNHETPFHQPSKITHLLALPAIHHPRPVKTNTTKKVLPQFSTESKFLLSVNPFACLDPEGSSSPTLPSEGSLLPSIMNSLCPNWSYASNHLSDPDGRIIFVWKPHINVTIIHQSRQYMTCRVDNLTADTLFFTAVYAANTAEERNDMWIELLDIQSSLSLVDQSWIVGGDFNEITHPAEHSDPSVSTITPSMSVFNSCLSQLEIRDLRYHGAIFTWSNKCPEDPIAKKLDRALINEAWLDSFPRSLAQFLAPDISDHTPCCITLDFPLPLADTKPFKFFNYLTAHPDFLSMVAEALIVCLMMRMYSPYNNQTQSILQQKKRS